MSEHPAGISAGMPVCPPDPVFVPVYRYSPRGGIPHTGISARHTGIYHLAGEVLEPWEEGPSVT
jgi:hypothetical protein